MKGAPPWKGNGRIRENELLQIALNQLEYTFSLSHLKTGFCFFFFFEFSNSKALLIFNYILFKIFMRCVRFFLLQQISYEDKLRSDCKSMRFHWNFLFCGQENKSISYFFPSLSIKPNFKWANEGKTPDTLSDFFF